MRISSRKTIDLYQRDLVFMLLLNLEEAGMLPISLEDLHLRVFPVFIGNIEAQRGVTTMFFRDHSFSHFRDLDQILFGYNGGGFLKVEKGRVLYTMHPTRLREFVSRSIGDGYTVEDLSAATACACFYAEMTREVAA